MSACTPCCVASFQKAGSCLSRRDALRLRWRRHRGRRDGKNHHRDGSFARHVAEITIVTPTGTYGCRRIREADLFWATAGGMGLTGVIVSATLRLEMIETTWLRVQSQPFYHSID